MSEEQQFEEIVQSDRHDFPVPPPAPDLENLAMRVLDFIRHARPTAQQDDYTVILSALHEALRGKEAECQTCETLCQRCGVEHAAKIAGKDAEINRLTAENARLAVLAELFESDRWRLVRQTSPPSPTIRAEMLDKYGQVVSAAEAATAVDALLAAHAALAKNTAT